MNAVNTTYVTPTQEELLLVALEEARIGLNKWIAVSIIIKNILKKIDTIQYPYKRLLAWLVPKDFKPFSFDITERNQSSVVAPGLWDTELSIWSPRKIKRLRYKKHQKI